jgi:hypothetical protein
MTKDADHEEIARHFGLGADARIAGLPLSARPRSLKANLRKAWADGWLHCHSNWSADARTPTMLAEIINDSR